MQNKTMIYLILTLAVLAIWCKATSIGEESEELDARDDGEEITKDLTQAYLRKRTAHSFLIKLH
jgi:hypothetical protein